MWRWLRPRDTSGHDGPRDEEDRLYYVRGPEGIIVELAEQIS